MSSELERYKTTCIAQEAEIARLQIGFYELVKFCNSKPDDFDSDCIFDSGIKCGFDLVLKKINRITGTTK